MNILDRADDEPAHFPPVIALVGPTAVGKSRHALELCRVFDGVIVSADSRQVYRYMDVGTAKPSQGERAAVPHYMIDVVEPSEAYSAQRFALEADRVLRACRRRGQTAFVVGGTGFYISLLLDRRSLPTVPPQPELRTRLRTDAAEQGVESLHDRLKQLDAASAARIHPNNLPRVIRALEIIELTGRPVPKETSRIPIPSLYLGLDLDRADLHRVADCRIDEQIRSGLIEEVETLLAMGYAPSLPALDGLGYRQMIQYLQGELDRDEAIRQYRIATHQYIRRQMTWFRKDRRIEWIPVESSTSSVLRRRIEQYLVSTSRP